jgi:hypothetical protein
MPSREKSELRVGEASVSSKKPGWERGASIDPEQDAQHEVQSPSVAMSWLPFSSGARWTWLA